MCDHKKIKSWLSILLLTPFMACASQTKLSPPRVVKSVDLKRYMGEWYEIATIPMIFQWGCSGAKATYKLLDKNKVSVLNECDGFFGVRDIEGTATVDDPKTPAKLTVDFGFGRKGEYWIVDLDEKDYQYAVVSNSSRSSLWILYRKPTMTEELYKSLVSQLKNRGFKIEKLKKTKRPFSR